MDDGLNPHFATALNNSAKARLRQLSLSCREFVWTKGPVCHEVEFMCNVYEDGRVVAGPETLRRLATPRCQPFAIGICY